MHFFFSYARDDDDPLLQKFYTDLKEAVRRRTGLRPTDPIGFIDQEGLARGSEWAPALSSALREAKSLVALYSPTYFQRPFCGQEFGAFMKRRQQYVTSGRGNTLPAAILPVIWTPSAQFIPASLSTIQFEEGGDPPKYLEMGLRQIMNLSGDEFHTAYELVVERLAGGIVKAAGIDLPPLDQNLRVEEMDNQFAPPAISGGAPPLHRTAMHGPSTVRFVYVACRKSEIEAARVKTKLTCYGENGPFEWTPFPPQEDKNRIGIIASLIAAQKGLYPMELPLGDDLIDKISEAKRNNSLVLLLVDSWSLYLKPYRDQMVAYDNLGLRNCGAIVLTDASDEETRIKLKEIEGIIDEVFDDNQSTRKPRFFRQIDSVDQLQRELEDLLETLRLSTASQGEAKRPVKEASIPRF